MKTGPGIFMLFVFFLWIYMQTYICAYIHIYINVKKKRIFRKAKPTYWNIASFIQWLRHKFSTHIQTDASLQRFYRIIQLYKVVQTMHM